MNYRSQDSWFICREDAREILALERAEEARLKRAREYESEREFMDDIMADQFGEKVS